jgi:hypothetical protein
MTEDKIKTFIMNGCYGENQWSYIVEMLVITSKSLMPSDVAIGNNIDYKRFSEELKLWKYYRHGDNNSLLNIIKNFNEKYYWELEDDSIYSRIVPIVIVNSQWEKAREEVIKNVLYTTGSIENLIESVLLSKILYTLVRISKEIEFGKIVSELKEEIIHLSQKEIIERYWEFYRADISTCPYNYIIEFERLRIDLLNILNEASTGSRFKVFSMALDIIKYKDLSIENIYNNFWLNGLVGIINKQRKELIFENKGFIENLCTYLYKLRKGRINPESIRIEKYILPDIFRYREGEEFFHSLLNKSKVVKKVENDQYIISYIRTKSYTYRFKKEKLI